MTISKAAKDGLPGLTGIAVLESDTSSPQELHGTDNAMHTKLYSLPADYRSIVIPSILNVPTAEIEADGDNGATQYPPHFWRVMVVTDSQFDDISAAEALMTGNHPDVRVIWPGQEVEPLAAEGNITDVFAIAFSRSATDVDTYTNYAYITTTGEVDVTDILAQMAHWTFPSGDAVRVAQFDCPPVMASYYSRLRLTGASYQE